MKKKKLEKLVLKKEGNNRECKTMGRINRMSGTGSGSGSGAGGTGGPDHPR